MMIPIEKFYFRSMPVFDLLPANQSDILLSHAVERYIGKHTVLYRESSYPKWIYLIKKGKVKIFQTGRDGKEQIIYIYSDGDMFGYRPLICDEPHPVTAATLDNSLILCFPRKIFFEVLNQSYDFVYRLLINLSFEFTVFINKITVFTQLPVLERTALALRVLNEIYKPDNKGAPYSTINLSRDDLAAYVGTVKETLVRQLRKIKDDGIIETEGKKIRILNADGLKKYFHD